MSVRIRRALLRACRRAGRSVASFLVSRRGAAMLVSGGFAIVVAAGVGAQMTNYAFKEAQWEELRSALRASVSAAGPLLAGAGGALDQEIRERVAGFLQASLARITVSSDDVTVDHDATTGVTTIGIEGRYVFLDIWPIGEDEAAGPETGEAVAETIAVKFEVDRYEVAVALDISGSMDETIPGEDPGSLVVKLDSLKSAMNFVADVMDTATQTTPGSLMVSVVPFASAVNVADTATAGQPAAQGRTAARERYVRMLAGAPGDGGTITATLQAARDAIAAGGGQWVDSFNQYGVGNDLGLLRKQGLPQGVLDNTDWNLRRTDLELDVREQAPNLDTGAASGRGWWLVNDEDFWSGCIMARWGASWNESTRPPGWTADDPGNWPVAGAVDGWSPKSNALPASTPLHLADAPPDAGQPHTLFSAYSWPDARIGGYADHRLQLIMARLLEPEPSGLIFGTFDTPLPTYLMKADNDWSIPGNRRGATLCPRSPITPLTDDLNVLRQAVAGLQTTEAFKPSTNSRSAVAATYLNLGIVWGLRTLSPLWQRVWQVNDIQGVARPGVPCAADEEEGPCNPLLNKSILIISDGASFPGQLLRSRLRQAGANENPRWEDGALCTSSGSSFLQNYHAAAIEEDQARFDAHFSAYLDGGRFGGPGMDRVLDAVQLRDRWASDTPARRSLRRSVLSTLTPWQLFRGLDAGVLDRLMDEHNELGFDGRPVQMEHLCRPSSAFSSYGRVDDRIYVGNTGSLPVAPVVPVADAAPFSLAGLPATLAGDRSPGSGDYGFYGELVSHFSGVLDDWFVESCRIASQRRVRVNAIYIGDTSRDLENIRTLERCVDAAGGDPDQQDVFVTPNAQAIQSAFVELFTIRRKLRFLN